MAFDQDAVDAAVAQLSPTLDALQAAVDDLTTAVADLTTRVAALETSGGGGSGMLVATEYVITYENGEVRTYTLQEEPTP